MFITPPFPVKDGGNDCVPAYSFSVSNSRKHTSSGVRQTPVECPYTCVPEAFLHYQLYFMRGCLAHILPIYLPLFLGYCMDMCVRRIYLSRFPFFMLYQNPVFFEQRPECRNHKKKGHIFLFHHLALALSLSYASQNSTIFGCVQRKKKHFVLDISWRLLSVYNSSVHIFRFFHRKSMEVHVLNASGESVCIDVTLEATVLVVKQNACTEFGIRDTSVALCFGGDPMDETAHFADMGVDSGSELHLQNVYTDMACPTEHSFERPVEGIACSPCGSVVYVITAEGIHKVDTVSSETVLVALTEGVYMVVVSRCLQYIYAASCTSLTQRCAHTGAILQEYCSEYTCSVHLSGALLISSHAPNPIETVVIRNVTTREVVATLPHCGLCDQDGLAVAADGSFFVTAGDGVVVLWDAGYKEENAFAAPGCTCVAICPEAVFFVVGYICEGAEVRRRLDNTIVWKADLMSSLSCVHWSSCGQWLVGYDDTEGLAVVDAKSGTSVTTFADCSLVFTLSPCARYLLWGDEAEENTVKVSPFGEFETPQSVA